MKNKLNLFIWFLFLITLNSCARDPDDLSLEERYAVDTIYSNRFERFRSETDSMCQVIRDSVYNHVLDSLKTDYLREIEMMLENKIIEE